MIVLVDRNDPEVRIELRGSFAESDAETLLRTFPELRRIETRVPDGQLSLFDEDDKR